MQFYKTEKEFRQKENIEPECVVLTPWEDFGPAIEQVIDKKRIVYDFSKLVESLAESYRKTSKEPEDPYYDFETQAVEWIDYNTMRSLPYFREKFRPIVVTISEEELTEFLEQAYKDFNKDKITQLMQNPSFIEELAIIRQFGYDEFEEPFKKLLRNWVNE